MFADKARNGNKEPWRMRWAGLISLILHGSLTLPFFLLQFKPQKTEPDLLLVELYGMIAERQHEETPPAPAAQKPSAPKAAPTQPRPQAPQRAVPKQKVFAPESPVLSAQVEPTPAVRTGTSGTSSSDAPHR